MTFGRLKQDNDNFGIATHSHLRQSLPVQSRELFVGQIIRLPVALTTGYPDNSLALDPASRVLLSALRWWVAEFQERDDPLPRLCQDMDAAGAHDAAFSVDHLMAIVVRSARRSMTIHPPHCHAVSEDEKLLLGAARLVQAGQSRLAERALRTALLSTPGAELALGPLQGLSDLFAEAKLIFRGCDEPMPVGQAIMHPLGSVH